MTVPNWVICTAFVATVLMVTTIGLVLFPISIVYLNRYRRIERELQRQVERGH